MIEHVKFVTIPVTDQERAIDFYREKLGFEVTTDAPFGGGLRWIEVRPPGATTRLVLFPPSDDFPIATPSIVFASDDVSKTHEELSARGVHFTKEPYENPSGQFAHFKDPDGNEFLIASRE